MKASLYTGAGGRLEVVEVFKGRPVCEFEEYTNKITGRSDPCLNYGNGKIAHMSSVGAYGHTVKSIEDGTILWPRKEA